MKKFAFLTLSALMLLAASCSDDNKETPRPPVPTDPVVSVNSVADQVSIDVPEQYLDYEFDGNLYRFKYANGQELVFDMQNDAQLGRIAIVKKIQNATEAVIPSQVYALSTTGDELVYNVIAMHLYKDGALNVKKLTVAGTALIGGYESNSLGNITDKWVETQLELLPDLEEIYIEEGTSNYCTINGAVYTANMKKLVGVPHARAGIFTIAEDTEAVGYRAFYYCSKLTAITFPAGIKSIGEEAVTFNDNLVLINMLPEETPLTYESSFGKMAQTGLLRIPAGSLESYFPARPDIEKPVPPVEPEGDDEDEWDAYDIAKAEYDDAIVEYEAAMTHYNRPIGFRDFSNVEQVTFQVD